MAFSRFINRFKDVDWTDPKVIGGIIVAVAAIAGAVLVPFLVTDNPEPDFRMKISPNVGSVEKGAGREAKIEFKSLNGYREPIALRISDGEEFIITSSNVELIKHPYDEEIRLEIETDRETSIAGDYDIKVVARGEDNKEKECVFTLTIKGEKETREEEREEGEESTVSGTKITSPVNGQTINTSSYYVEGTIADALPEGKHAWLGLYTDGNWWPQMEIGPGLDIWGRTVYFGGSGAFEIFIVYVNDQENLDVSNFVQRCEASGDWPGIALPANAEFADKITVNIHK
ncbi:MAG: hypothetical protein JW738_07890 [Actinobacteria bacterium]|nr:hypothetical protein [Actinomycetota bacterium]